MEKPGKTLGIAEELREKNPAKLGKKRRDFGNAEEL
jgi:hypothetical protein